MFALVRKKIFIGSVIEIFALVVFWERKIKFILYFTGFGVLKEWSCLENKKLVEVKTVSINVLVRLYKYLIVNFDEIKFK